MGLAPPSDHRLEVTNGLTPLGFSHGSGIPGFHLSVSITLEG